MTRKTTDQEKEAFEYLNCLRESGITNMFGAAPFLQKELSISSDESRKLLSLWMEVFNEEGNYEEITYKN